jgi:hypothetical protein
MFKGQDNETLRENLHMRVLKQIGSEGIDKHGSRYRHIISDHLYRERSA